MCIDAESGENIALVGASGSGKSTIINLLSRFYEVQQGTVRFYVLAEEDNLNDRSLSTMCQFKTTISINYVT